MNAPVKTGTALRVVDFRDAADLRRIECFVAETAASLFHRPAWLRGIKRGTGQRAAGIVAERLGTVTGWLPFTEVRSALFGKALVSSGFGVGGGIIAEDDTAKLSVQNTVPKEFNHEAICTCKTYGQASHAVKCCTQT